MKRITVTLTEDQAIWIVQALMVDIAQLENDPKMAEQRAFAGRIASKINQQLS